MIDPTKMAAGMCNRFSSMYKRHVFSRRNLSSTSHHRILVVGSGAIGLRTAKELLERNNTHDSNVQVILKSSHNPLHPSVCSMGAGGLWMPFHANDKENRIDRWALETLNELYPLALDPQCDLAEIIPAISLFRDHSGHKALDEFDKERKEFYEDDSVVPPGWTSDRRLEFQHLTVEMLAWQNIVLKLKIPPEDELKKAGYIYAWMFKTPIVETEKMLSNLLATISSHPQTLDVSLDHEYASMDEICQDAVRLGCDSVINCSGLGAGQLCNDDRIVGLRGILQHYNRSDCPRRPEVMSCPNYGQKNENDAVLMTEDGPWGSETEPCYMIPRGDVIVVGGSCIEGDDETSIRTKERERLRQNAHCLGIDVESAKPVAEWTGFRPYRDSIRCEIDSSLSTNSLKVVHSYGYGGSGWTLNVGAAKDVAQMVLGPVR